LALYETLRITPRPATIQMWEDWKARFRQELGEEAFAQAWAAGQALTLDQAVEYALERRTDDGRDDDPSPDV
jgi:hypothetical protein